MARRAGLTGDFWPTDRQEALLRVVLADRGSIASRWERCRADFDLDRLEAGSFAAVPALAAALDGAGVDDELTARLNGVRRRTWYRNQVAYDRLASVITVLGDRDVRCLVLKHAALAFRHYADPSVRDIIELDVLVERDAAEAAAAALIEGGWRQVGHATPRVLRLAGAAGPPDLVLRRAVPAEVTLTSGGDAAAGWWDRSQPLDVADVSTAVLGPVDELVHVCAAGARAGSGVPVQWVLDAAQLIPEVDGAGGWSLVVDEAVDRGIARPMAEAFRYVGGFGVEIPADVVGALDATPSRRWDRLVYRAAASGDGPLGGLPQTLALYARASEQRSTAARLAGLPAHLRDTWGLSSVAAIPGALLRRAWAARHPRA